MENKNNFAVMHSALTSAYMALVKAYTDRCQIPPAELSRVISILEQAVAIKPRNCDVGAVKEQTKRKIEFCYKQGGCFGCPFNKCATFSQCALAWAQMPYKEGAPS